MVLTASSVVRLRLVMLSMLSAGTLACAGRDARASPPAEQQPVAAMPASSPKTEGPPALEGLAEVAEVLAREHVRWTPQDTRMALARRGGVRLRSDGPEYGFADGEPFAVSTPFIVLDNARRPRVVSEQGGVRLLLFVDRADATPIVLDRAPLAPTAGFEFQDPPRRGHVVILPGAWVHELEREDEAVLVRLDRKRSRKGWIDSAVIGTSFVAAQAPKSDDADQQSWLQAKRRTKIMTRPGGPVLVTMHADESAFALTERATDGHRLVEYHQPYNEEVAFVGFVASADLRQPNMDSPTGTGRGSFSPRTSWGDAESAPRVEIEKGRFLFDVEHPVVVGCVATGAELADLGEGRYAVATMWGPVPVRLAPESVDARCGEASDPN